MQQIDTAAIDSLGIPRMLLMDHAGRAVAEAARRAAPDATTLVLVCCGPGFNGGDGFAAARYLHDWGYPLRLLLAGRLDRLREEPAAFATVLRRLGLPVLECPDAAAFQELLPRLTNCGLVIDALLGIGTRGAVREPTASIIRWINGTGKPIVAVDIPSGLDADTGCVQGEAVRAAMTVTFGLPKQGCVVAEGPAHTGSLRVDPITIPRSLLEGPRA